VSPALDTAMAMHPAAVRALLDALQEASDTSALLADPGRRMEERPGVRVRGSVAVIPITGGLTRYDNWLSFFLGGRSTAAIALDVQAALNNPAISRIVLEVDSPGGEVTGIHELANLIRSANARKPVTAYIGGTGASAAYWLASAAGTVVTDETALVGSIGIVMTYTDTRQRDAKAGVKRVEIVSSNAPNKRPDMESGAGRAQIQSTVDALMDVFLADVARFRGVTPQKVASDFGQGGLLVGGDAVRAGMVDGISSLEDVIAGRPHRKPAPTSSARAASRRNANAWGWDAAIAKATGQTAPCKPAGAPAGWDAAVAKVAGKSTG
jgi:signal peptide peptidase SppA